MDQKEILWSMYQEHCTHGRHHESLRATTTNLLLVIAAAAIAVMTRGETLGLNNLPLALLLFPIGMFGAIFSAKYHERFEMHMERADRYRAALLEGTSLIREIHSLAADADVATKKKHPWLFGLRLYKLWIALHFLVAALGLTLTVTILIINRSRL